MAKLEIRYWSRLNLCWTEKEMEFDTREEAEEYIDYLDHDKVTWAKIDGQPVEF